MKRHWMIVLVILTPILLAGCDTGICTFDEADDARKTLEAELVAFDGIVADIETPATADDVAAVVASLTALQDETASLDLPRCAEDSRATLLVYMETAISLLEESSGLATEADVADIREAAGAMIERFNRSNFQMLQEARSPQR